MSTQTLTISGTTPNAPGNAVVGVAVGPLDDYDALQVVVTSQGATGGTLDLYLQATFGDGLWMEYAHFTQLAAAAPANTKVYTLSKSDVTSRAGVAIAPLNANPTPTLAAATVIGGPWGRQFRLVAVAGVGTSAGAAQTVTIYGQGATQGHGH